MSRNRPKLPCWRTRKGTLFCDPKCTKCGLPVVIGQKYWSETGHRYTHEHCMVQYISYAGDIQEPARDYKQRGFKPRSITKITST